MDESKPVLIVGLGNPGGEYSRTRHNVGFMAVDALAGPDAEWKKQKNSLVAKSGKTIFAKPQTFMNLSGPAVLALMTFYKAPLENLVVIHDDIDLNLGDVRQKVGGGSAGHNGIKSIDAAVGNGYRRIRIGVGRPAKPSGIAKLFNFNSKLSPADWVLGKFSADEMKVVAEAIGKLPVL